MNCKLCGEEIKDYSQAINKLQINQTTSVDICPNCIEKFTIWQQEFLAKLFPTKTAKKYLNKKENQK